MHKIGGVFAKKFYQNITSKHSCADGKISVITTRVLQYSILYRGIIKTIYKKSAGVRRVGKG